jgi:hypothetical protein
VAESAAAALEVAMTDAGRLLVELEKFRAASREPHTALRAEALALGQRARRLYRSRSPDDATGAALVQEAAVLLERLREALRAIRATPEFRAAVEAHRTANHAALAMLLPRLLAGLEHVGAPPPLMRPVEWLRRNRPRAPAELAGELLRLREGGVPGEGDAQTPGTDPELPAVSLQAEPPPDPLLLRFPPQALPPLVFRLRDGPEHLVHTPVLLARFAVVLPHALDPDELGEISLDHPRYRAELLEALTAAGLPVEAE